jgi:predicted Holliday junction resolvase-like endonuclease
MTTIKTLNSEYIVDNNILWKNGEVYTDDIRYIGTLAKTVILDGLPNVGDMLYIEYYNGETMRSIRTSMVTEVSA